MTTHGFHYFPDELHYRRADLQTWLLELLGLDAKWITLIGSMTRAVPEAFIRGLWMLASSDTRRCGRPPARAGRARGRRRGSRARPSCAGRGSRVGEELDRAHAVLGEALLDLARLLVRVHVERELVLLAYAPSSSSQSRGHARTEWGATPTRTPAARSSSSSRR